MGKLFYLAYQNEYKYQQDEVKFRIIICCFKEISPCFSQEKTNFGV